jgi:hypothetical protein
LKSIHMDEKSRKEIRVKKTAALQRRL